MTTVTDSESVAEISIDDSDSIGSGRNGPGDGPEVVIST